MSRRDRDDRPPIEVFGGAPDLASEQTVEVGSGSGSDRRWWLLVVVVVVVVSAMVAFGGGDGGEEAMPSTTTTVRRAVTTSSTTSTMPAPLGPVLPVPTGGALVLATENGPWQVVDLDSGTYRELEVVPRPEGLYGAVAAMRGGLVVVGSGVATYVPILPEGPPVALGEASQVQGSGHPGLVWLSRSDESGGIVDVRLVDLRGRVRTRIVAPPFYLGQATVDGLLTGGGGRVYLVDAQGARMLGVGVLAGGAGSVVAIEGCDERARCRPELVDTTTGSRRAIEALAEPMRDQGRQYVLMADEAVLETTHGPAGMRLRWVDPSGRLVGTREVGDTPANPVSDFYGNVGFNGDPIPLAEGLGVLWMQGDQSIVRLHPDGRGGVRIDQVPIPSSARADRLFLVMP